MESCKEKTLNQRLQIFDFNGDTGLIGHELSFEGLFSSDEIDKIRNILGINQDEINVIAIVRKMRSALSEQRTSDYQKLGIDLYDSLTEYFLKGET